MPDVDEQHTPGQELLHVADDLIDDTYQKEHPDGQPFRAPPSKQHVERLQEAVRKARSYEDAVPEMREALEMVVSRGHTPTCDLVLYEGKKGCTCGWQAAKDALDLATGDE